MHCIHPEYRIEPTALHVRVGIVILLWPPKKLINAIEKIWQKKTWANLRVHGKITEDHQEIDENHPDIIENHGKMGENQNVANTPSKFAYFSFEMPQTNQIFWLRNIADSKKNCFRLKNTKIYELFEKTKNTKQISTLLFLAAFVLGLCFPVFSYFFNFLLLRFSAALLVCFIAFPLLCFYSSCFFLFFFAWVPCEKILCRSWWSLRRSCQKVLWANFPSMLFGASSQPGGINSWKLRFP